MKKSTQSDDEDTLIVGKHYPALDGLRGIAVLMVIWFHSLCSVASQCFVINQSVPELEFWYHIYYVASMFGHTGVDLFFVISGFLITGILIDTRNDKNCLKNFYIRRSLRIFPAYYAGLLILIIFMIANNNMEQVLSLRMLLHVFYLQNWWPSFTAGEFRLLSHTWSLAIEEQFYLFWPAIFLSFYNGKLRSVLILCISLIAASWFLRLYLSDIEKYKWAYTSTFSRVDALILGALLSVACKSHLKRMKEHAHFFKYAVIILSILILVFFIFNANTTAIAHREMTKIGLSLFALFYTALIAYIFLCSDKAIINRVLSCSFLRSNGQVSYGLYIVHVPVIEALAFLIFAAQIPMIWGQIIIFIVGYLVSLNIASLSYTFFEKPILKLKDKYTYDRKS